MKSRLAYVLSDAPQQRSQWTNDRVTKLVAQISSLVRIQGSASLLIFGPAGAGKTSLAISIVGQLGSQMPKLRRVRVDCENIALLPDVRGKWADELAERSEAEATLFKGRPKGWLVVLDHLDALTRDRSLSPVSARIWESVQSIWHASRESDSGANPTVIIGTCRDPSTMPAQMLDRFDLMHYLAPLALNEVEGLIGDVVISSQLLDAGQARIVAANVSRLLADSKVARVGAGGFLRGLSEGVRWETPETGTPDDFARRICVAGSASLFDQHTVSTYESRNQPYIDQSDLLSRLS